jgi:uncharacterized protein with PIN domain
MIVVDTSAVVAIALAEPERESFVRVIEEADKALIVRCRWSRRAWWCMADAASARWCF